MTPWLLDYIRCPACRHRLATGPRTTDGYDVVTGTLHCENCGRTYPIEGGAPRLVVTENPVQASFAFQWSRQLGGDFESSGNCFGLDPARVVTALTRRLPAGPPEPGSIFLDAGCGLGEKAALLAERHPDCHVVAFDLTPSVCALRERYPNRPNLHFVQADLNHNPFVDAMADVAISIGVIHHTADPRRSFDDLTRLLKPERSHLLLWVYLDPADDPNRRRYYWRRDVAFLGLGRHLPLPLTYGLCYAYTWLFALPGYALRRALSGRNGQHLAADGYARMPLRDKARSMAFVLFDDVTPRHQHRLPLHEVMSWFHSADLTVGKDDIDGSGLFVGHRPERPEPAPDAAPQPVMPSTPITVRSSQRAQSELPNNAML